MLHSTIQYTNRTVKITIQQKSKNCYLFDMEDAAFRLV